MKKISAILLLIGLCSFAPTNGNNRTDIVVGTNCVAIAGNTFPLNQIVLKIYSDSINVQFFTVSGYNDPYDYTPITAKDSFNHYTHNGTQFTSVSQIDSFYIAKFVK